MRYKKIMVLAILLVSLLAVSTVSAQDNATSDVVSVKETTVDVVKETDEIVSTNEIDVVKSANDCDDEINVTKNEFLSSFKDGDIQENGSDVISLNCDDDILNSYFKDSDFKIDVNEVYAGDTAVINISLPVNNLRYLYGEFSFGVSADAFHYRNLVNYDSSRINVNVNVTGKQAIVSVNNVLGGMHSLYITYKEGGLVYYQSKAFQFYVKKHILNCSVDIPSEVNLFDDVNVKINVNEDAYLDFIYCDIYDNKGSLESDYFDDNTIKLKNGKAETHFKTRVAETIYLVIEYEGDDKYEMGTIYSKKINVNPLKTEIIAEDITCMYTEFVNLIPTIEIGFLGPGLTGEIEIYEGISTKKLLKKVNPFFDDIHPYVDFEMYTIHNWDVGTYYITYVYRGDNHYSPVNKTFVLNVSKLNKSIVTCSVKQDSYFDGDIIIDYKLTLPEIDGFYGNCGKYVFKLYDSDNNLLEDVSSNFYGEYATFRMYDLKIWGTYKLVFEYFGDKNHNGCTLTNYINIKKIISSDMISPNFESNLITYNKSFLVTLPVDAQGILTLSVNDENYTYSVINGACIINLLKIPCGSYKCMMYYSGDDKYYHFTKEWNLEIDKIMPSIFAASPIATVYGGSQYLSVTLKGENGKLLSGVKLSVFLDGKEYTWTTDKYGQIKMPINDLIPKKYDAKVIFYGDKDYEKSTATVKVTVKKATPKLTAKAKTFKKSVKTKKYTVTLKTNQNKVMKNTKVTLKVNGKTYSAKTNAKGQATFKITKLTKKGKFTAVVKFAGNKYYNAKTVKPKITVK